LLFQGAGTRQTFLTFFIAISIICGLALIILIGISSPEERALGLMSCTHDKDGEFVSEHVC